EARVRVHEALTGVTGDLADLNMAVLRVEERAERMQARAGAIDALLDASALDLPGSLGGGIGAADPIERELRQETAARAVEDELAALKAQAQQTPQTQPTDPAQQTRPTPQSAEKDQPQ